MTKIKLRAVILDYGGVISQPQHPANMGSILRIMGQTGDNFKEIYERERAPYDRGQITAECYWRQVLSHYDLDLDWEKISLLIQEDVESWTHLNDDVLRFIREIRPKIFKLAIISNMTVDSLAFIEANFDWLDLFDVLDFSCNLGLNKPDQRIYTTCLEQLGLPADECLFVDDSATNIEGARLAGLRAIHFKSFPQFISEFDEHYFSIK